MIKKYTLGIFALAVLMGVWLDAAALTLGRARGSALLGQALEVTVPVQFGPDEDATQTCFDADVFYGDVRQEASAVALTNGGQTSSVRIRARAGVDEPVVTVYLKSTCGQKSSRKYVLLADLASEIAPAEPALNPGRVPLVMESPKASGTEKAEDTSNRGATSASTKGNQRNPRRDADVYQAPLSTKPAKVLPHVAEASRKPRLKLAPLDMSTERDPVLRSTNELLYTPAEDVQKRAEALATWRALNASAQDVLRDEARLQAMESDVKRLAEGTARNRAALQEVTGRLEVAESQRYANPLVYGLAVGLMACLAALAFLWQRLRSATGSDQPWWSAVPEEVSMLREDLADVQGPMAGSTPATPEDFAATAISKESREDVAPAPAVDIDLEMGESVFAPPHVPLPRAPVSQFMEAQPSTHASLRAISTKEMRDVRQQAEFFITLGQYDDGIGLLENSIKSSNESNPLVYLDLLKALHTLSRKMAFEAYRSEFNKVFTGIVPPYARFNQASRGLDAYPDICQQIVALWPSEAAIQFMESCMVREPGDALDHGFDLDAFRDLLLLHAVAKRLPWDADSGLVPFSTMRTAPAAAAPRFDGTDSMPVAAMAPTGVPPSALVDLDLSEPAPRDNLIDFDLTDYKLGSDKDNTPRV